MCESHTCAACSTPSLAFPNITLRHWFQLFRNHIQPSSYLEPRLSLTLNAVHSSIICFSGVSQRFAAVCF